MIKIWNLLVVVSIWVLWSSSSLYGSTLVSVNSPLKSESYKLKQNDEYTRVQFKIDYEDTRGNSYRKLMDDLRAALRSGEESNQIPLLRREFNDLPISQRYILVELRDEDDRLVTIAINVINVYVIAYAVEDRSYFFSDTYASARSNLFTNTQQLQIAHTGDYGDLERAAGTSRESLNLGIFPLDNAITSLFTSSSDYQLRARSLLVCIQMISEAARFRYIEQLVVRSIRNRGESFQPNALMLSLQNNWGALSEAVQGSSDRVFPRPVQLRDQDGTPRELDNVNPRLVTNLALMLFVCIQSQPRIVQKIPQKMLPSDDADASEICTIHEPTVRILGLNGKCADVKDGSYANGNPIILWPCSSDSPKNQLWTLKTDGTIRSNGKCLTAFSNASPGDYVMIFDCGKTAKPGATKWEILDNGDIINPDSQLYLTSKSSEDGTGLTVEKQNYTLGQGWSPSNNTQPLMSITIVLVPQDLCVQSIGTTAQLQVGNCQSSNAQQKWDLYPDGSIRSHQNQQLCFTSDEIVDTVTLASCKPALRRQRWEFTNEGYILNFGSGYTLVALTYEPVQQIYIGPINAVPDAQEWMLMP